MSKKPALAGEAAAHQTSGVNVAMVYRTDGGIAASGLVVPDDDNGLQPVYRPVPLPNQAVLREYPEIAAWLAPVFSKLMPPTLQALNRRIQVGSSPGSGHRLAAQRQLHVVNRLFARLNSRDVLMGLIGSLSVQMAPSLVLACLNTSR